MEIYIIMRFFFFFFFQKCNYKITRSIGYVRKQMFRAGEGGLTKQTSHRPFFSCYMLCLSSLPRPFSRHPSPIAAAPEGSINDTTPTRNVQVFVRCSIMIRRASLVQIFACVTLVAVAADQGEPAANEQATRVRNDSLVNTRCIYTRIT